MRVHVSLLALEQQAPACQNNPSQQHLIYLARAALVVNINPFSQPALCCRCSEHRAIWMSPPHLLGKDPFEHLELSRTKNQLFEPHKI